MDAERFARFLRTWSAPTTRRLRLQQVVAGAAGLITLDPLASDARKRKKKKKKPAARCLPTCAGRTCGDDGCGSVCGQCGAGQTCSAGACVPLVCGNGGACRVFVTSSTHQGDLSNGQSSGLTGADSICQQLATDAGLPGTYMAWLSDYTDSPATRFMRSPGPYHLVNGTMIATSWDDLTDGALAAGIHVDERGNSVPSSPLQRVWTNTAADGTQASSDLHLHCGNWTTSSDILNTRAAFGFAGVAGPTFTNPAFTWLNDRRCNEFCRLYCFQQS